VPHRQRGPVGKFTVKKLILSVGLDEDLPPVCELVLRFKWITVMVAVLIVVITIPSSRSSAPSYATPLRREPLYMPMTLRASPLQKPEVAPVQDKVLRSFPEVSRVFGKAGRAETATDPAPSL